MKLISLSIKKRSNERDKIQRNVAWKSKRLSKPTLMKSQKKHLFQSLNHALIPTPGHLRRRLSVSIPNQNRQRRKLNKLPNVFLLSLRNLLSRTEKKPQLKLKNQENAKLHLSLKNLLSRPKKLPAIIALMNESIATIRSRNTNPLRTIPTKRNFSVKR